MKNGCIQLTFYLSNFVATKCLSPSAQQITALRNESFIQYSCLWELASGGLTNIKDFKEVVMKRVAGEEPREKTAELAEKDVEIHQLQQELEHEQV